MVSQKIMNPQALISIFGSIPNFSESELIEVQLRRDGPTLFIKLMTNQVLQTKPKRWDRWDVIYIEMSFFAVSELKISGLGTDNKINKFEIIEKEDIGFLNITCNSQMAVECKFDWARVEQITPGLIGSP
jgi:hypothetical protein